MTVSLCHDSLSTVTPFKSRFGEDDDDDNDDDDADDDESPLPIRRYRPVFVHSRLLPLLCMRCSPRSARISDALRAVIILN